jgi:3-oxoacyl-(acyl-carrier-protein) synthase
MTAANSTGVIRCIHEAMATSGVSAEQIDLISGHLTATNADRQEIQNWTEALNRAGDNFPLTNSLKSMIGHSLSAAGSIETVASILQIVHGFVHPNINFEDPNPEITNLVSLDKLPVKMIKKEVNIVAKANFGFGDVNSCLILSKYK